MALRDCIQLDKPRRIAADPHNQMAILLGMNQRPLKQLL